MYLPNFGDIEVLIVRTAKLGWIIVQTLELIWSELHQLHIGELIFKTAVLALFLTHALELIWGTLKQFQQFAVKGKKKVSAKGK